LEDEIMRIFGGEQIAKMMDFLKIEEDQPIEHAMVSKAIESAQVKVEGFFFDQRKRLVEFDDVMNKHREIIYKRRRRLLEQTDALKPQILGYVEDEVTAAVTLRAPQNFTEDEYDAIVKEFVRIIPFDDRSQRELLKTISELKDIQMITEKLMDIVHQTYAQREKVLTEDHMRQLERVVTLSTIDEKWMEHLDEVEDLRQGIWLRGDKQTVLSEYKKEAFNMFEQLIQSTESTIANRIFRVHLGQPQQTRINLSQAVEQKDDIHESLAKEVQDATPPSSQSRPETTQGSMSDLAAALRSTKAATTVKGSDLLKTTVGRNDPCPCGSGLKYKKCGLINAPQHRG
jgi:preprotein translocase subunit SecA